MNGCRTALKMASIIAVLCLVTGCATQNPTNPQDPYEGFNRSMFTFNEKVDSNVLKPVAQTYKKVMPSFLQTGIGNFFGNLGDIWICANNLICLLYTSDAADE